MAVAAAEIQAGGVAVRARPRQALDASHNMVPAEQTERRNLIMVNPIEGNTYATTRHLVAAYQCVMPGDQRAHAPPLGGGAAARAARQGPASTPSSTARASTCCRARCCSRRRGAGTATPTRPRETGYWIDFLDIPFIQLTEAMFFEPYPQGGLEAITSTGPTPMRIPSREALGAGQRRQDRRDRQGHHADDRAASDPPAEGRPRRRCRRRPPTPSTRWSPARRASSPSGFDETAGVGDVIAMPCWHAHTIEAPEDTVVFKVSDEPIFEKLGLREDGELTRATIVAASWPGLPAKRHPVLADARKQTKTWMPATSAGMTLE